MREIALALVRVSHQLAETTKRNRLTLIKLARDMGASWDQIGAAMGMNRQTAHKQFSQQINRMGNVEVAQSVNQQLELGTGDSEPGHVPCG